MGNRVGDIVRRIQIRNGLHEDNEAARANTIAFADVEAKKVALRAKVGLDYLAENGTQITPAKSTLVKIDNFMGLSQEIKSSLRDAKRYAEKKRLVEPVTSFSIAGEKPFVGWGRKKLSPAADTVTCEVEELAKLRAAVEKDIAWSQVDEASRTTQTVQAGMNEQAPKNSLGR